MLSRCWIRTGSRLLFNLLFTVKCRKKLFGILTEMWFDNSDGLKVSLMAL